MTGPTRAVRAMVIGRDGGQCQWCGRVVDLHGAYSLQHRRARGMGGSSVAWVNSPANLVTMCGTGTTGCHGWVEAHPAMALERGYRLGHGSPAEATPIRDYAGRWWLLATDGTREAAPQDNEERG